MKRGVAMTTVGIAAAVLIVAMFAFRPLSHGRYLPFRTAARDLPATTKLSAQLVEGTNNSIRIPADVAKNLGVRTEAAKLCQLSAPLTLSGTLALDAARMQEVRSRFDGEVVEIGATSDGSRPIQFGDHVSKGQLLAVVWSRELGEKKSQFVDALSQYQLDADTLTRLEKLYRDGSIPERQFREAERAVEADRIALARVQRTLQTWRISDEEIATIQKEARDVIHGGAERARELTDRWARLELVAALDGIVLERNVTVGDMVSSDDDLFKVANLSRLRVLAYAYEEDLPTLDALPESQRHWKITVPALAQETVHAGAIEQIGHIIDPRQHTAFVMGWVDNPEGRLRAGQFVTATVDLPPPGNEVVVPASALIEKWGEQFVFVQEGADTVFTERRVALSRELGHRVCLYRKPPDTPNDTRVNGLQPGDVVVTSGAVELHQALTDLRTAAAANATPAQAD